MNLMLTTLVAAAAAWPQPPDLPASHTKLDQAYLAGDYAAFAADAPRAMQDAAPSELQGRNVRELIDRAYAENGGELPGEFRLPDGLLSLEISQRRVQQPDVTQYAIEFLGKLREGAKIRELKLVRYPDEVVLARSDSRYQFGTGGEGAFWLKRVDKEPSPDGLYKVVIEMEGGASPVEAWVPIVGWQSDRAPEVIAPLPNQSFDQGRPTVSWRPGNEPMVKVEVIYNDAPSWGWDVQWRYRGPANGPSEHVVRQHEAPLGKGRHLLDVAFVETRRFGDLGITRNSTTRIPFYIR